MKTLLIIRHAKSSWADAGMNDFDRPLNDRGRKDAPMMARRLVSAGVKIDLFVSSTAKRAKTTAALFIQEFGRDKKEILLIQQLYHAAVPAFREVVFSLDNIADSAAIFSHNPGITAFANSLSSVHIDDMPTCSIFAVTSPAASWKEFTTTGAAFLFFDYPRSPGSKE